VRVRVAVGVPVGVTVKVAVAIGVPVGVATKVDVGVMPTVGVLVRVATAVGVTTTVGVGTVEGLVVGVGVGEVWRFSMHLGHGSQPEASKTDAMRRATVVELANPRIARFIFELRPPPKEFYLGMRERR
jgi:hypothetical protein